MKRWTLDILAGALVVAVNLIVFGYHSGRLGFYADDAGFLFGIYPGMGTQRLIDGVSSYVTGRNLHIIWQYFISVIAGGSAIENLPAMHYVQVGADATTGLLLFLALRLWYVARPAAFVAAISFSFYPVHDETHYWLSSLPMNIISTAFVLALVCLSALLLRALSATGRDSAKLLLLLVVYFVVFLCSMFTYDQTVPVVMVIVTLVAATIFYRYPSLRISAAGGWLLSLAVFVSLVFWKARIPAGGPIFSNLTLDHIILTFQDSVDTWSSLYNARAIAHPFRRATIVDQIMAVAVAGVTVVATWFFLNQYNRQNTSKSGESFVVPGDTQGFGFNLIVLIVGAFFYLLAYLPAYLWYLSPRHSYLPSIGMATIAAGLFGALAPLAKRMASVKSIVLIFIGVMMVSFIARDLIDKNIWITAFEMRKAMYQAAADRYTSENPTAFLFSGFPSAITREGSPLAFLSGENRYAPSIMTSGKIVAEAISLHPVPSQSGYFIKTEEGRWGSEFLVHVARKRATIVLFESIDAQQLKTYYDAGKERFSSSQFYSLTPIARRSDQSAFAANASAAGYDVGVPAVSLKEDEVLALVGYSSRDGQTSSAFHSTPADMEAFTVPVDVSAARDGAPHAFHLEYEVSMSRIDGFRLYVVGSSGAKPVAEIPVK
jgi:hypothetical protein